MSDTTLVRLAILGIVLCGMMPWIGLICFMLWQNRKGRRKSKGKPHVR
jgi:hypothetical protein